MGDKKVNNLTDKDARSKFIKNLLNDIQALEIMLEKDMIEKEITRIGAEQEFCLVNSNWRPSKKSTEILKDINDTHFTTEIALFNLEINLDPIELSKDAFTKVENQLNDLLKKAAESAKKYDNNIVLTGILPTISKRELEFDFMTPLQRYWTLNDMLKELRGNDFRLHMRGVDELFIKHNSVLFEGCNTSFQMHLQIDPDDFIQSYNWAQAISGPILGICTNSPLLLGRELWSETRIALFQQSIDTRKSTHALKDSLSRVSFSNEWVKGSVVDIFKNDISNYKIILAKDIETNSTKEVNQGKIPKLEALCTFNGTIYRWNRPCYGIGNGKAHLRIENRYIPAGPTSLDEIANFAFWVGLMNGRPKKYNDIPNIMDFKDAKANFVKSARTGKESVMNWMGQKIPLKDLIVNELIPIAKNGLKKAAIDQKDIDRLLEVIEGRVKGLSGSQWSVENYRFLRKSLKRDDALGALTREIHNNQKNGLPVHQWSMIEKTPNNYQDTHLVEHVMSTQLFTVHENDLADLAINIMEWKNIHHVPVENTQGELTGLLTWEHLEIYKQNDVLGGIVADIMIKNIYTAQPETKILEAIHLMKVNEIGCLPVVEHKNLVGIITIKDIIA